MIRVTDFDDVARGLGVSPALVEGYVSAAAKIARLALNHETAPTRKIYRVREDCSQEDHRSKASRSARAGASWCVIIFPPMCLIWAFR